MASVLIVDDSTSMRAKLRSVLTECGHNVVAEAVNGFQALREYPKYRPDFVTMDIQMPLMDGVTAVKKILESFPDANIIMVSSLAQRPMILSALESGAKHYIIKPFDNVIVDRIINEVLGKGKPIYNTQINTVSTSAESSQAFTVDNYNGIFMISIKNNFFKEALVSLSSVLEGIIKIDHLIAIFNFLNVDSLETFILEQLVSEMEHITESGGDISIVSENSSILEFIKSKNLSSLNKIYSSLSEIPLMQKQD